MTPITTPAHLDDHNMGVFQTESGRSLRAGLLPFGLSLLRSLIATRLDPYRGEVR